MAQLLQAAIRSSGAVVAAWLDSADSPLLARNLCLADVCSSAEQGAAFGTLSNKSCLSGHDNIADIPFPRHSRQMTIRFAILVLSLILSLTACSAEPAPSVAQVRTDEAKAGETITTISIVPPQWRKDPDCFEPSAQTLDDTSGYFDVERIKWRNPRTYRGYYNTNFEGGSFVAAQRTEHPDGLGEGRYQTELHSDARNFPSSVENQTYWIEFVGREALCNSQRPDDAKFDVPFSRNLVRVEKIIQQARVR